MEGGSAKAKKIGQIAQLFDDDHATVRPKNSFGFAEEMGVADNHRAPRPKIGPVVGLSRLVDCFSGVRRCMLGREHLVPYLIEGMYGVEMHR